MSSTGVLISPYPDQERNKLQRQKILMSYILFIVISGGILVLNITRLESEEIFSPSNKIHWEVGRAKDLSAHQVCKHLDPNTRTLGK